MSKRLQETQGGEDRYGGYSGGAANMADKPQTATAAQMANRRIAQARKASGSQRSSRANTPTANPFAPQQQSMPAFQPPAQGGTGFGGDFNFSAGNASNPFAQQSNGTPPPTSFQFGGTSSQPQSQSNGVGGIFGNKSTSFGSTFPSGNSQPQQNGFNPSITSMFGSQSNNANSGSSFTFGQTSQSQQNGATPSTNASFPTFGAQKENPFKNFGQSQQTQSTPATSFSGFGQGSQPTGDKPQANGTSSIFANNDTPKTATSSIFGSFGQQPNGDKTTFGSTSQADETPKANTGSIFGAQQQTNTPKPLFGSTPPPTQGDKSDGSVFLGLDSARSSTVKAGMFTSGQSKSPEPSSANPFSFGQTNVSGGQAQETPKATSLFSNANQAPQANGEKTSISEGGTSAEQQTPKPSTSLFNLGQSQQQPPSTPGFKFGQTSSQTEDASMTTPGNTPQKPSLFAAASSQQASTTPANQGRSLFDRVSKDPSATAPKGSFTPSTSLFSQPASTSDGTSVQNVPSSTPGKSLFDRAPQDEAPSTAQKQTSFAPSTNLFNKPAESAATTPSAAPWLSHTPAAPKTTVTPPTPQRSSTISSNPAMKEGSTQSQQGTFKSLNEGLLGHLASQDRNADWTRIMQYYLQQAAEVRDKSKSTEGRSAPALKSPTKSVSAAPERLSAGNMFSSAASKPSGSNMFSSAASQQTPKTKSLFQTQPPATAPANNKRSAPFEEDDGDDADRAAPATEKRARPNDPIKYPDLPANASATSKLFQAALDKSNSGSNASSSTGIAPSSSSAGFNPPTPTPSGMPTFAAPASNPGGFLASFGKKASAEEEKQREKRKADDYDSDEESEEQWLKRDREEQEAKRRKIAEAAKTGSGFDVSRSVTPIPPPETPAGTGKSLMDCISKDPPATAPSKSAATTQTPAAAEFTFGSKTPAATSTSNMFGGFGKSTTESRDNHDGEREDGDKTWKPETPIKFGGQSTATGSTTPAAPPPAFGNLFGSLNKGAAGSTTGHLGVPNSKPSLGFNFGGQPASLSTSRATTPGMTTDGEGASTAGEGEDEEAAQNDPQVEDQSALHPKERAEHEVLFEIAVAKASKFGEKRDAETGEISKGWVEKGKGPLYVLKNKATGNTSVLMKIKPLGRPAMNFSVQEKMRFEVGGASGKLVNGGFVDTLADPKGSVISRWMIQVGKKEDAAEMVRVLNEAAGLPVETQE